jgi:hypothetical protein
MAGKVPISLVVGDDQYDVGTFGQEWIACQ